MMGDVIKLAAVLDACGDIARVDGVLRRLQVVTLTPQLSRSTGIDQKVEALQSHDNPGVCALSKIITSAWSTQLTAERQRLALKVEARAQAHGLLGRLPGDVHGHVQSCTSGLGF